MKDTYPLVSVVVPLYNHEHYIKIAVESVLSQDYPNMEIIVIDDGSTDNSAAVVEAIIANSRESIRIIKKQNEGITKTLNLGIRSSRGEYICILASDDYLLPGSITCRVEFLEGNRQKLAVFGDAVVVDSNGRQVYQSAIEQLHNGKKSFLKIDTLLASEIVFRWSVPGPVFMARRALYDEIGFYDENILVEDWDFYLRIACKNLLGFIDRYVAAYRIHDSNSYTTRSKQEKYLRSFVQAASKNIDNYSGLSRIRLILLKHRLNTVLMANNSCLKLLVNCIFAPVCLAVSFIYYVYAKAIFSMGNKQQ